MHDDLRQEAARLQKQADELARIISDEGHFPAAAAASLLQDITRVLAELAERCPRMHGED